MKTKDPSVGRSIGGMRKMAILGCGVLAIVASGYSEMIDATPARVAVVPPNHKSASALMRQKLNQLLRADAGVLVFAEAGASEVGPAEVREDLVVLDPVVVMQAPPPPVIATPRETKMEKFFRTGTFAQRNSRKVVTRFWMKGDRGLMLSFNS